MKRKLLSWSLLFLFIVAASELSAAEEFHWHDKLKRGSLNIVTFPVEFVRQFHLVASKETSSANRLFSFIPAFGGALLRLGAGVVELVTFPFDFPTAGKTPLVEPEYVWESY